jgi:4-hydroxy-tetrahydrodipicolinate reductase
MLRVAVAGAAGRMGEAVCAAVHGAQDLELCGRADPQLGTAVEEVLDGADVLVDFTQPDAALGNALGALAAGVHAVVGTTGFDLDALQRAAIERAEAGVAGATRRANAFYAPNFAIGAVLMTRFAVEAAQHMAAAEIVELHHDSKLDAPSGTAKRTAQLIAEATGTALPPVHSVRLPGLVAHQEVIFGDIGQTLTIRHDSLTRESFMPGVLLAVRRVGSLAEPFVVGLETLLFPA